MKNELGLDVDYFRKNLTILLRDVRHHTPNEMTRALQRLADVATPTTIKQLQADTVDGWRSCIDHIIKPESACPVCAIEQLEERIKELEEKSAFNERWIDQTCETGQINAQRNQNTATGYTWILSVAMPEES